MSQIPELRLAICKRCRWPSRIAAGADTDAQLRDCAKACVVAQSLAMHVRLSQCLNCCDGGHTVRLEWRGWEFAFIGIRTDEEVSRLVPLAPTLVQRPRALAELTGLDAACEDVVPDWALKRLYQVWFNGEMLWHKHV